MVLHTNFSDALNKTLPPIPRVWFNRPSSPADKVAFLNTLIEALKHDGKLIYIASIKLDKLDRKAALRIAWLRAKTFSLMHVPSNTDIVGTLGEWAVLRDIGMNKDVVSVSLVSLGPESKPDFFVNYKNSNDETITIPFDIKTTAAKEPSFSYDPVKHRVKGDPHILGLRLSDTWNKADFADIFLTRADQLIDLEMYQEKKGMGQKQCFQSLNGNVQ